MNEGVLMSEAVDIVLLILLAVTGINILPMRNLFVAVMLAGLYHLLSAGPFLVGGPRAAPRFHAARPGPPLAVQPVRSPVSKLALAISAYGSASRPSTSTVSAPVGSVVNVTVVTG